MAANDTRYIGGRARMAPKVRPPKIGIKGGPPKVRPPKVGGSNKPAGGKPKQSN